MYLNLTWRCLKRCVSQFSIVVMGTLSPLAGYSQEAASKETTTTLKRESMPAAQTEQEKSVVERYHTREGRMQAKALDWSSTLGKPKPVKRPAVRGKPETSDAGTPNPDAKREGQRLHPEDWRKKPGGLQGRLHGNAHLLLVGSPDVFTQYCENCLVPNTDWPMATIGKLFLNGGFCSASVVSPNNVIVTAAHCCYDRNKNRFIGGWVFAPAYDNGNTPFGVFDWSSATVLNSWINNGDIPSDVCTIRLANDQAGRGVSFYTGWLGRSWNFGSVQEHHALGYPNNLGGGNTLQLCTSESFSPACGGPDIVSMGCSMTFGSSGGPWIRAYRDPVGASNWVNSVVHGPSCQGTFGQTFNGARFTSVNIVPLCNAEGC